MKFLKLIALMLALFTMLTLAVSCNSGDGAETTAAQTTKQDDGTTAAPFITKITVIALDEEGEGVEVFSTDEAVYNGLKSTSALTASEIVADYCADNDIECSLDADGCLEKVGEYTTADYEINGNGVMWTYYVNEVKLSDFDAAVANGAEIVVKMVVVSRS